MFVSEEKFQRYRERLGIPSKGFDVNEIAGALRTPQIVKNTSKDAITVQLANNVNVILQPGQSIEVK